MRRITLAPFLDKGKVLILGIGNTLRGDDGFGSILASRIKNKVPFEVIDGGVSPENYLERIVQKKPDVVLIIDALDLGIQPGELRIIEAQALQTSPLFFTHNVSISMLINYLKKSLPVDIIMLIIQPQNIKLGEDLSPEVKAAITDLERYFDGFAKTSHSG
jgi:hydrogenase 3 maturation protease